MRIPWNLNENVANLAVASIAIDLYLKSSSRISETDKNIFLKVQDRIRAIETVLRGWLKLGLDTELHRQREEKKKSLVLFTLKKSCWN